MSAPRTRNPALLAIAALVALIGSSPVVAPRAARAADPLDEAQKGLASTHPVEVMAALARVAEIDGPEARKVLVRTAIRGPSLRIRRAATDAFGARKDREQAIDSLVFRLQNPGNERYVALHAAEALGRLASVRTEKALLVRVRHSLPDVADAVRMGVLGVATGAGAVEACKDALAEDASPRLRAAAADGLARIGGDEAIAALATAAGRETSRLVRERIVSGLLAFGPDAARDALFERHRRAGAEERVSLLFAAARIPSPGLLDAARKATESVQPVQVAAGCMALSGADGPLSPEDEGLLRERLDHREALVRDAALHALLDRTGRDPEARISLLRRRPPLPSAARVALLASLQDVSTAGAREALLDAARSRDYAVVVTAVGALRRGHGAAGREILNSLASGTPFAGGVLDSISKSMEGGAQPRAFVAMGNGDRAEEVMGALGRIVTRYPSGSSLSELEASPEDVVVVDGPGEMDKQAESRLRRFLHLGGTLVLLSGYDNRLWKDLVPDAVDRAPSGLRVQGPSALPSTGQGAPARGIEDFDVYAAAGSDPSQVKTLGASPAVMLVPFPVPLRTAAAKPLLWSSEMAEQYGGDGCVAAEVRMGCGRILLMGGVVGLRGALQDEGWFTRVRVERRDPLSRANTAVERAWVAYDSFGLDEGRVAALDASGYFDGNEPFGMADHPAARWLKAWLDSR